MRDLAQNVRVYVQSSAFRLLFANAGKLKLELALPEKSLSDFFSVQSPCPLCLCG